MHLDRLIGKTRGALEADASERGAALADMDTAERVARRFHEVYELLAPDHGYETRPDSAVPWADVPARNRELMVHVAAFLLRERTIETGPNLSD